MKEGYRKKRLFLAFNLPREVKLEVGDYLGILKNKNRGVSWVAPEGLHVTLHFLGNLDEGRIGSLERRLAGRGGSFERPEFEIGEAGAFPGPDHPRVVYLTLEQLNGRSASDLQKFLGRRLSEEGIEPDGRPWTPHITLGRAKDPRPLELPPHDFPVKSFEIKTFELMESELGREGARYKELFSYDL